MMEKLVVAPRSYIDLAGAANAMRKLALTLGAIEGPKLDIIKLLAQIEDRLGTLTLDVVEAHELPTPNCEGITRPSGEILLREDVYDEACDGEGRPRFTATHELGHWALHRKEFSLARKSVRQDFRPSCPEWQANSFASFLLMPRAAVSSYATDAPKLAEACGTSERAAQVRIEIYNKRKL